MRRRPVQKPSPCFSTNLPPVFVKSPLVFGGGFAFKAAYNFFCRLFSGQFQKTPPHFSTAPLLAFLPISRTEAPGAEGKNLPRF